MDETSFRKHYTDLLGIITAAAPDAAILMTVPNDSYLYRRNANPNTGIMQKIIYDLAEQYSCGVWDFYEIMGGFNSSSAWFNAGLMSTDLIHFNKAGYILKGDLFFSSFIESWSSFNSLQYRMSGVENYQSGP
jgi:lysophospholipase L1-like esterase